MKRIVLMSIIFIMAVFLLPPVAGADSLLSDDGDGLANMYGTHKASRLGDILTIVFIEKTVSKQTAKGKVKNVYTTGVDGGKGLLDWFLGVGLSGGETVDVETTTSQDHSLVTVMSAKVEKVMPNGNLYIVGSRTVEVNHEPQVLTVTGEVRVRDITYENRVNSDRVANLQALMNGTPVYRSTSRRRGGIIRWVWGLLF